MSGTCVHCGAEANTESYRLRFRRNGGRKLRLELCDDCYAEFVAEPDIKRV